jgi:VWFA-related protein
MSITEGRRSSWMRAAGLGWLMAVVVLAQNGGLQKAPARNAVEAFQAGLKAAQSGRPADARRDYEKAVTLDPDYGEAWQAMAKLQVEQKDLDAARKSYEAAIRAQPSHTDYCFELAGLEQGAQNWNGLIDMAERLIKLNASDYPEAYLLSATGYYQSGNVDRAEERAQTGEKLDTRQQFPKLHELLGWILVSRGNPARGPDRRRFFDMAAEEFRKYLKAAPATAHTAEVRATLSEIEGQPVGAAPPTESEQPSVILRSTVTLVQVDVIAKDSQGRPVEGLKKDDFELTDNGKPQQIASFVMGKILPTPQATPRPTAPNVFTNRIADANAPRAGYAAILMDWFNTGIGNTQRARLDALKVLKGMDPDGKVALYSLDREGLHLVNEFGSSRAEIVKSISSMSGPASPCRAMQLTEIYMGAARPETLCDDPLMPPQQVASFLKARITDTQEALQIIAEHLSAVPGRKILIWISSGVPAFVNEAPDGAATFPNAQAPGIKFGEGFEATFRKLNNAGVSVYPIDARGLPVGQIQDDPRFPGSAMVQFTTPIMDEFAARTGGVAFYGRNNIDDGIRQALEDSSVTYLLGYYAPQDDSRPGFHKIGVKVHREGVKLRYREGYSAEAAAAAPEDRRAQLSRAALAPLDATAIPIEVTAERKQNALTLRITVKPGSLGLAHDGDRWRGSIDVATQFVSARTEPPFTLQFEPVDLDLAEEHYAAAEHDGLVFPKTLDIPAGADRVKVLERSGSSGDIGSVTIPLRDATGK